MSVVGLRVSNPKRRNGSSVWGSGGGFVLLDDEEDAYSAVLVEVVDTKNDAYDGFFDHVAPFACPNVTTCGLRANGAIVEKEET